jgi:hypothetical protein
VHEDDGYYNLPPLNLFDNQLIDLTLSIGFFGFSWAPEVASVGGNSQYVGGKSNVAVGCHIN